MGEWKSFARNDGGGGGIQEWGGSFGGWEI